MGGYPYGGDFVIGGAAPQTPTVELVGYVAEAPAYTSMVGLPNEGMGPGPAPTPESAGLGDASVAATLCVVGAGAAVYQLFKSNLQKESN